MTLPPVSPRNDLKMRNELRSSILMTCHNPDLGRASVEAHISCGTTNQKHYPDLGRDTSLV